MINMNKFFLILGSVQHGAIVSGDAALFCGFFTHDDAQLWRSDKDIRQLSNVHPAHQKRSAAASSSEEEPVAVRCGTLTSIDFMKRSAPDKH